MRSKNALWATACCLCIPCFPVNAQDGADTRVEEIIVTARKRPESVLKVPVVQTVLTQAQLDRQQIIDLNDIAAHSPGIILATGAGYTGTQISLRGVGTSITDPGVDQSVSLNIDGLQVTQGSAYSVGTFDMAQVEILRGPQALFFGKASSAGVISIRTADPGEEAEIIGRVDYETEARTKRGELILSGPLSDTLGVRVGAQYSDSDGFFKNTAVANTATGAVQPPSRFGESDTLFARGTIVFTPSDRFSMRAKLNYSRERQEGGTPQQLASCPEGTTPYAGVPVSFFSPNENCKLDRNLNIVYLNPANFAGVPNNGVPFTHITQKFGTVELNYELSPELTLTSVTGHYDIDVGALYNGTLTGSAAPTLAAINSFGREEFTQELRLNSDFSAPLNFSLGAFYQDGELKSSMRVPGNSSFGFPALLLGVDNNVDIEAISLFGQLRYQLTPKLELSGGARWTHEERSNRPLTITGGNTFTPTVPKLSTKNWSPELTLTYTPTDDLTLFGSLKQAYKSGSYNLTVAVLPGGDNSFGDEKARGGEVGMKARLLDRQLNLNVAGYFYVYEDLQTGAISSQAGGIPIFRVQNAGESEIYGVDIDMSYRPDALPGLTLNSAVNWNHARFTDFATAPCWGGQTIAEGCALLLNASTGLYSAQDLSGARLPRAPDWQINLGADYEGDIGKDMRYHIGVGGQYTSKYLGTLGRRPDFFQGDEVTVNANLALKSAQDTWEVALIGKNLFETYSRGYCSALNYAGGQSFPGVVTGGATRGASGMDELQCVAEQGPQFWIRLTFKPFSR